MFLYCVSLFHALLIYYSTFQQILDPAYTTSTFNKFLIFTVFVIVPIKDFLTALLFSYLYYYQGLKQRILTSKQRIKARDNVFLKLKDDDNTSLKSDPAN